MARRKWQYKVVGVKGLQLAKLVKGWVKDSNWCSGQQRPVRLHDCGRSRLASPAGRLDPGTGAKRSPPRGLPL